MISNQVMKKKTRDSFDYRCNGNILICKWHDNSIVNIASTGNYFTHQPVLRVNHRVKGLGSKEVPNQT